jgi:hypothetical protein
MHPDHSFFQIETMTIKVEDQDPGREEDLQKKIKNGKKRFDSDWLPKATGRV